MFGAEESVKYILEEMKTHGPFDGVLSFSQGSIMFRHLYRIVTDLDSASYPDVHLPSFVISVGGPYFPKMTFDYKGKLIAQDAFTLPLPSVHIYGKADEYKAFMTAHTLFTKEPLVIYHDEGHKFPRAIADEDYAKLTAFVKA